MDGIFDGGGPLNDFQTESFSGFPGWDSLSSFSMQGFGGFRGGAFAIDNMIVQQVPEPSTSAIALFAGGAILTAVGSTRRQPAHVRHRCRS
jgi:hypothetical protein